MTLTKLDSFRFCDYEKARKDVARADRAERWGRRLGRAYTIFLAIAGIVVPALIVAGCEERDTYSPETQNARTLEPITNEDPWVPLESGSFDTTMVAGGTCHDFNRPPVDREVVPFCIAPDEENLEIAFGTYYVNRDVEILGVYLYLFDPFPGLPYVEVLVGQPWEHGWAEPAPSTLYTGEWIIEDWQSVIPAGWSGAFGTLVTVNYRCPVDGLVHQLQDYEGYFHITPQCEGGGGGGGGGKDHPHEEDGEGHVRTCPLYIGCFGLTPCYCTCASSKPDNRKPTNEDVANSFWWTYGIK